MKKKGLVLFICALVLLFGVGTVTALSEVRFSWEAEVFTTVAHYVDINGNRHIVTAPPENPDAIPQVTISVPTTLTPETVAGATSPEPTIPEIFSKSPENIARYAKDVEHNIQVFIEKQQFSRSNLDTKIENNDLDPDSPPIKEKLAELDILESEGEALLADYRAGTLSDEEAASRLWDLYYKDWNTLSLGYNLESNFFNSVSDYSTDPYYPSYNGFSGDTLQNDVFVNDVINIKNRLFIRGGTRLTNHSQFGTYVSPNVSAALILPTYKMPGDYTKFRSSWGQSINTPTLYQMFGRLAGMMDPNPNLKAEKLNGWDVGVEQTFFNKKVSVDFGYFSNKYKDYIGWQSDPITWIGTYMNVDEATINGYEASIKWQPNLKFKMILNYTFMDSEDARTGYSLPAVPKNGLNASVVYTPKERFSVYARVETASDRVYSGNSTVGGYTNVAAGTIIRLFSIKGVHVYLKVQVYNILDQKMSMYKNYYQPGIHFMAGLFIKMNTGGKEKEVL